MKSRPASRRRGLGSTTVEFALIMVIFLNFAVGAVEMMNLYSAWSTLQWACDGAARQTMVAAGPTAAGAQSAAQTLASSIGYTTAAGANFTAAGPSACVSGGATQCITVRGSFVYTFKLSTLGLASVTLQAQSIAPLI